MKLAYLLRHCFAEALQNRKSHKLDAIALRLGGPLARPQLEMLGEVLNQPPNLIFILQSRPLAILLLQRDFKKKKRLTFKEKISEIQPLLKQNW